MNLAKFQSVYLDFCFFLFNNIFLMNMYVVPIIKQSINA